MFTLPQVLWQVKKQGIKGESSMAKLPKISSGAALVTFAKARLKETTKCIPAFTYTKCLTKRQAA